MLDAHDNRVSLRRVCWQLGSTRLEKHDLSGFVRIHLKLMPDLHSALALVHFERAESLVGL